jgi:hypothetical protein
MSTPQLIAVCSARTRASTQNARSYFLKTGASAWGRDVYHIKGEDGRTLCGRDCSEYLTIGPVEIANDHNCCERCRAKAGAA